MTPSSLRARLQLSLGTTAELGEERATSEDRAVLEGVARLSREPVLVTWFAEPPLGPEADALRDKLDRLRSVEAPLLELPLAQGECGGRAWVVERDRAQATLRERTLHGLLPLAEGVNALRDVVRTVVAMHRAGLAHGNISIDTVVLGSDGARLCGAPVLAGATRSDDIDALGKVAWTIFTGERTNLRGRCLSQIRRSVPPALDVLCMSWLASSTTPDSATAILDALDDVHAPSAMHPLRSWFGEHGDNGGRSDPHAGIGWALGVAAVLILVLIALRH